MYSHQPSCDCVMQKWSGCIISAVFGQCK